MSATPAPLSTQDQRALCALALSGRAVVRHLDPDGTDPLQHLVDLGLVERLLAGLDNDSPPGPYVVATKKGRILADELNPTYSADLKDALESDGRITGVYICMRVEMPNGSVRFEARARGRDRDACECLEHILSQDETEPGLDD